MNEPLPPSLPERKRKPLRRRLIWLLPLLFLAVFFWGYIPTDSGPAAGFEVKGSAVRPTTRSTLRVATFNIHSGRDAAGHFDLDRTAKVLKNFDLIALN